MAKKNSLKKALITSALSMVLCSSMLVGTTYAWFTDSVTSMGNVIKTGTLDVSMSWAEGKEAPETANWKNAESGAIFNNDKWEPGHVEAKHIKIENDGTLALKYELSIVPNGEVEALADVIDVYLIEGAKQIDDRADLANVTPNGTLRDLINGGISSGKILVENESTTALESVKTLTLVLKMREEAGNDYQDMSIGTTFSVQLLATQYTYEKDSFNDQYDKDATYSGVAIPADAVKVTTHQELSDALAAGGNIALAADIEVTSSLDVTKDADLYAFDGTKLSFASTAQMKVKNGATLDLMNVTVDNGDTFGFDADGKFQIADVAGRNTAAIFDVSAGSHLIIEKATTISNVVGKNQAVVMANGTTESRATVTVKGTIEKCAGTSGGVIYADKCADVYIEDGAVLKENVSYNSHNYGLIKIYRDSMFYMNGGEITNNLYSGNGLIGFQNANAEMNGGIIHNNNYYDGADSMIDSGNTINSRHGLIYAHSDSEFVINGGEIINNTVTWYGALDCMRKDTVTLVVNDGGTVKNNRSREVFTSESTGEEYAIGTEFFGTITSEAHITLSKNADVSGLIQDLIAGDDIFKDVTTLAK